MDMGVFNQDMYKNSYSQKPFGSGQKKEKKRGIIDMISAAQMRYAAEKNGVPLPADVITTGHIWDYSADIMETGLIDILITFLFVAVGIIFLIASGSFYNFHSFFFLNYVIGGFIFAIPGSYYSLMLTSTIARFYEKNLTNTAKIIRLIFNSLISIQILKFFIINVVFFAIFEALKKQVWLYQFCDSKIEYAIKIRNKNMYFLYRNILNTLTDKNYKTITEIAIDLSVGLIFILVPPIIAMVYKSKKTKNIENANIIRGQAIDKEKKGVDIFHDAKFDTQMTLISGTIGAGKSTLLNKIVQNRMQVLPDAKWIFYDITGEYMAQYYRAGDVILDITDRRCCLWNFLSEAGSTMVLKEFSNNIIPEDPRSHDNRFFTDAARRMLYDALYFCFSKNLYNNKEVKKQMLVQPKNTFERIKKMTGNVSISFTDVFETYKNYADGILSINTAGDGFILMNWLLNPKEKRRIFINYHNDTLKTQRPILNLFLTILSNMVLNQNFKNPTRINVVIDEFTNLGLLENIPNTLAQCRKKNIAFMIALQNLKEVHRIYDERIYNFLDNINNTYAFRTNDDKTAQMLADRFGKIEKKELLANTAVSTAFKQEHTTTYSTSIRETHAVLSSEFMTIPNFEYFGKIITDAGIKFFKSSETENKFEAINKAIYLPTDRDFTAEVQAIEEEILNEEEEKERQLKKEKEQKEQKLSKKDIKNALKKVKEMAEVATEEDKEDDNDANNQHS